MTRRAFLVGSALASVALCMGISLSPEANPNIAIFSQLSTIIALMAFNAGLAWERMYLDEYIKLCVT